MTKTVYLSFCGQPFSLGSKDPYYLKAVLDDSNLILELQSCTLQGHFIGHISGWKYTRPCKEWQPIQLVPPYLEVDAGL